VTRSSIGFGMMTVGERGPNFNSRKAWSNDWGDLSLAPCRRGAGLHSRHRRGVPTRSAALGVAAAVGVLLLLMVQRSSLSGDVDTRDGSAMLASTTSAPVDENSSGEYLESESRTSPAATASLGGPRNPRAHSRAPRVPDNSIPRRSGRPALPWGADITHIRRIDVFTPSIAYAGRIPHLRIIVDGDPGELFLAPGMTPRMSRGVFAGALEAIGWEEWQGDLSTLRGHRAKALAQSSLGGSRVKACLAPTLVFATVVTVVCHRRDRGDRRRPSLGSANSRRDCLNCPQVCVAVFQGAFEDP